MTATTPTSSPSLLRGTAFAEARELQWVWKPGAMSDMAAAICVLALAHGPSGQFSANDLELKDHGGRGIAGSIFHRLAQDEVITPVGGFVDGEFQQKYVRNAGGNRVGVWRLKSLARAGRLLELHSQLPVAAAPQQTTLNIPA